MRPYILRRLKTDKSIIADLPDKTEVEDLLPAEPQAGGALPAGGGRSRRQLEDVDGIAAHGASSSPSSCGSSRSATIPRSGSATAHGPRRTAASSRACATSRKCSLPGRRRRSIFTQFRETTAPLAAFLGSVFGRPGLVLHGETEVKKRKDLVRQFQEDESVPFFVLSRQGRRRRAQSHRRLPCHPFRPVVESGCGKPGH